MYRSSEARGLKNFPQVEDFQDEAQQLLARHSISRGATR